MENKWPEQHAAKVLRDVPDHRGTNTFFLRAGDVVTVVKEDKTGLIVWGSTIEQYVGLKRDNAIPVPNILGDYNPWDNLEEDQALVGDLIDNGFRLVNLPADDEENRARWQAFLELILDDEPLTILDHPLIAAVYIAKANPSTVSVATEIVGA